MSRTNTGATSACQRVQRNVRAKGRANDALCSDLKAFQVAVKRISSWLWVSHPPAWTATSPLADRTPPSQRQQPTRFCAGHRPIRASSPEPQPRRSEQEQVAGVRRAQISATGPGGWARASMWGSSMPNPSCCQGQVSLQSGLPGHPRNLVGAPGEFDIPGVDISMQ